MKDFLKNVQALNQEWPRTALPEGLLPVNRHEPIPFMRLRRRVLGGDQVQASTEESFLGGGRDDLRSMLNIAATYPRTGRNVLEWGVGCGRMARHLPLPMQGGFVGVDVDPVNIDWCRDNLPWGQYHVIPVDRGVQGLPFEDATIDLIYSYSVMTHLTEEDQNHWLAELNRVSRGLILLSVHGLASIPSHWWAEFPEVMTEWLEKGFRDSGIPNPDISDVVDPEYYRDVAHTPAYIRDQWSKFVDVVDIIPGCIGNRSCPQDVVVCKPKGDRGC